MDKILSIPSQNWQENYQLTQQQSAAEALESGQVIFLPQLAFQLSDDERHLASPNFTDPKRKNVNYNPITGELRGTLCQGNARSRMSQMLNRYATHADYLIRYLLPQYSPHVIAGRTSLRPVEAQGRRTSPKKDDTRLHVDAFPATPTGKQRILRVFSNINPEGKERVWHIGEPFVDVAKHFFPQIKGPIFGAHNLLHRLRVTKTKRSAYDHYMLNIHDKMKLDHHYQNSCDKLRFNFPPGSTWVVFTDSVSHAVLSGQHLLEQTFYLPYDKMQNPSVSPQKILQELAGRALV